MKPSKSPAKERKMWQEKRKKRGGDKAKSKSQDCYVTFKRQISKFSFPRVLLKRASQWNRRLRSAPPVNGFVVSFSA